MSLACLVNITSFSGFAKIVIFKSTLQGEKAEI